MGRMGRLYKGLPIAPCQHRIAHRNGCSKEESRFVFVKSLGYPATAIKAIEQSKSESQEHSSENFIPLFSTFTEEERAQLAICSLPETLCEGAIAGRGKSSETLRWLSQMPNVPLRESGNGNSYTLPDGFRSAAISSISESDSFRDAEKRWLPYARLIRNVPSKEDRSTLYLLSGLRWIESESCNALFGERSQEISNFLETKDSYFARRKKYTHISERIRQDLFDTATNLSHEGITSISEKASSLWEQRQQWLQQQLEDLDRSLKVAQERLQTLQGKHSQVSILLKRFQKNGTPVPNAPDKKLVDGKNGAYIGLIGFVSVIAILFGITQPSPIDAIAYFASFIGIVSSLALVPGWKLQRAAKASSKRAKIKNSPEYLKKENADLIHKIQENETAFDDLSRNIAITKEDLEYAYV